MGKVQIQIRRGSEAKNAKLTEEIVRAIRESDEPSDELAKRYGVHRVTINRARSGRGWGHVE